MSSALIGVIGVAAGALATGGVQAFLAWSARRTDAVAASRLLWAELRSAVVTLQETLRQGEWPHQHFLQRPIDVWEEEKKALSRATTNAEFQKLAGAMAHLFAVIVWGRQDEQFEVKRADITYATRFCIEARVTAYVAGEHPPRKLLHRVKLSRAQKSGTLYEPDVPPVQAGIPE